MKLTPETERALAAQMKKREALVRRLTKAVAHLPVERQLYVATSYMNITQLENCVRMQERR